jgi:multidrug resistance efflux pump
VVAAESEVARARADLAAVETQIAELVVTSPANGRVEVLRLRPGDLVAPGGAIGTLVELDRVFARVFVPEPDLGSTQLGRPVQVTVDSYPGTAFNGRIEFVAVEGEFTPRNIQTRDERVHQVFAVRVGVEDPSHLLRAGMAAEVSIPRAAASQAS